MNRDKIIKIRVNEEEEQQLMERAEGHKSLSEYIRLVALGLASETPTTTYELLDTIVERCGGEDNFLHCLSRKMGKPATPNFVAEWMQNLPPGPKYTHDGYEIVPDYQ